MQCTGFIDGYTDFKDGLLRPDHEAEFRQHLADCPKCEHYDRVLRDGLQLLSSMPEQASSDDFMSRLQHRLYNLDQGVVDASSNRFVGSAALVAVAGVGLLALFWLPFAASVPIELELSPVAVERPSGQLTVNSNQVPSLFRSGPFVDPASLFDANAPQSFLDGERAWYSNQLQRPRVFLAADIR
jgi:hypothetical protein